MEEFHGQRILAGYSPWSCKELDMKEQFTLSILLQRLVYYKRREIKTYRDTERRVPGKDRGRDWTDTPKG